MSASENIHDVLAAINAATDELGIRWFLFGAQAVMIWGRPRLTADVDVTAEVPDVRDFVRIMAGHGFELRFDDDDFLRRTRVLAFVHPATTLFVDVVLAGPGLEEAFLDRAQRVDIRGLSIPVISPEDLIVTKILAGRPKDIDDVRSILRERGNSLDASLIRQTLQLLEEALGQSDLLPAFEQELERAR